MNQHTVSELVRLGLAAGYVRISDDDVLMGLGVSRQRADIVRTADGKGIELRAEMIFEDNDTSAKGEVVRKGFDALKHAVEHGGVRVIFCYKIDRLSRNAEDSAWLDKMGERCGLVIIETSGTEYKLDDSSNSLNFGMLLLIAAYASKVQSERQRRKNEATRAEGWIAGGRRAFGYENGYKIIRDKEAEAIRWGYAALLNGASLRAIAQHWNDLGLRTPQGKRERGAQGKGSAGSLWESSQVSRCLRKAVYAGFLQYKDRRTKVVTDLGRGAWEPIIDEDTYYAAMLIMSDPKRKSAHGAKKLLTGIARCSVCDSVVNGSGSPKAGGVYACKENKHFCRQASPIDKLVVDAVFRRLAMPDARESLTAGAGDHVAALHAEKRNLAAKKSDLAELLAEGILDRESVKVQSAKLASKIADIDAELGRATAARVLTPVVELIEADDIRASWEALDRDVQRVVIDALLDIVIKPQGRGTRIFRDDSITITLRD